MRPKQYIILLLKFLLNFFRKINFYQYIAVQSNILLLLLRKNRARQYEIMVGQNQRLMRALTCIRMTGELESRQEEITVAV